MREVAPELLASRTGGIVYVDGADECRAEAGELKGYEGKLVEIGSLGKADIETREDADLTVWKSVSLLESLRACCAPLTYLTPLPSHSLAGWPRRPGRRHH